MVPTFFEGIMISKIIAFDCNRPLPWEKSVNGATGDFGRSYSCVTSRFSQKPAQIRSVAQIAETCYATLAPLGCNLSGLFTLHKRFRTSRNSLVEKISATLLLGHPDHGFLRDMV